MVTSPGGLASTMNKFFLDKIRTLRSSIPAVQSDPLIKMKEAMQDRGCSFKLKSVSEADVLKVIKSLKNSSATGVDYIDTRTVKLASEILTPALTHIIIATSTFPKIWKFAKHINLIHPNLHGSRSAHNTSTALIKLYDKWADEIDEGKMVGVLVCDQSAAFDLCDHYLLVEKLKLMGLEESATSWIWSYLTGRQQSCFVDGHLSSPLDLFSCGVPQGSIGGPLLWLCFTCDQPDVTHEHPVVGQDFHRGCAGGVGQGPAVEGGAGDCGELVGYVDDGAHSYAHRDPLVLSQVLSRKYVLLEDWINGNRLVINPDKTHLMVMGSKRISEARKQVSIQAGPFTIKPTEAEKLLGGNLHQSLKWNYHIRDSDNSIMKQLTSRINGLKKIDSNSTFNTRLMVANGVIMSKEVYLITGWGSAQQYLVKALQVQQRTAARTVCGFYCRGWRS